MRNTTPDVIVHWRYLTEDGEGLRQSRCLYAMVTPDKREIVYIGKAWGAAIAQRLKCRAKLPMWEHFADCGIEGCKVLLGELALQQNRRLTGELLSDVESLLIMAEQPIGNVQSMSSRITRYGMHVACIGSWLGRAKTYVDVGMQHMAS